MNEHSGSWASLAAQLAPPPSTFPSNARQAQPQVHPRSPPSEVLRDIAWPLRASAAPQVFEVVLGQGFKRAHTSDSTGGNSGTDHQAQHVLLGLQAKQQHNDNKTRPALNSTMYPMNFVPYLGRSRLQHVRVRYSPARIPTLFAVKTSGLPATQVSMYQAADHNVRYQS